jgi:hypothetical protein
LHELCSAAGSGARNFSRHSPGAVFARRRGARLYNQQEKMMRTAMILTLLAACTAGRDDGGAPLETAQSLKDNWTFRSERFAGDVIVGHVEDATGKEVASLTLGTDGNGVLEAGAQSTSVALQRDSLQLVNEQLITTWALRSGHAELLQHDVPAPEERCSTGGGLTCCCGSYNWLWWTCAVCVCTDGDVSGSGTSCY